MLKKNTNITSTEIYLSAGILLLNILIFSPLINADFLSLDDPIYVVDNYMVNRGIKWESIKWALSTLYYGNWSPFTWLSHMLDCEFFGLDPSYHHLSNILLHSINSVLFFLFLKKLNIDQKQALFATIIFSIHPLHVEPVAWISSRKDLLSGFFWFLSLISYLYYCDKKSIYKYVLTLVIFFIGLSAKSSLISLPAIFLLIDFWPLKRIDFRISSFKIILLEKIPFIILSLIFAYITTLAQARIGIDLEAGYLSIGRRIGNSFYNFITYTRRALVPSDLTIFYPHPLTSLNLATYFVCATLIISICIAIYRFSKTRPYMLIGWAWFCLSIAPYLQLTQVGTQVNADRWAYLPLAGICILMSQLFTNSKYYNIFLSCSYLLFLTYTSNTLIKSWTSPSGVFDRALKFNGPDYKLYTLLAKSLNRENKKELADEVLKKALKENPDYSLAFRLLADRLESQGKKFELLNYTSHLKNFEQSSFINYIYRNAILNRISQSKSLEDEFTRTNGISPRELAFTYAQAAIKEKPNNADAHVMLGNYYLKQKEYSKALTHFKIAIKSNPNNTTYLMHIGSVYEGLKDKKTAINIYQKILALEPGSSSAYLALAKLRLSENKNIAHQLLIESIKRDPRNISTLNELASLYFSVGKYDQTLKVIEQSLKISPDQAKLLANKSATLLKLNKIEEAYDAATTSKRLDPDNIETTRLLKEIETRLPVLGESKI